jgi:hypothetical protein
MSQAGLEELSRTHKGVVRIQAEKDRLLQKVSWTWVRDNGQLL